MPSQFVISASARDVRFSGVRCQLNNLLAIGQSCRVLAGHPIGAASEGQCTNISWVKAESTVEVLDRVFKVARPPVRVPAFHVRRGIRRIQADGLIEIIDRCAIVAELIVRAPAPDPTFLVVKPEANRLRVFVGRKLRLSGLEMFRGGLQIV